MKNIKGFATKAIVAAVAAGALLFAAPTKSQAQVFVGVGFGRPVARVYVAPRPVYVAPAPVYVAPYGYYARRDAFIRHEEWLRAHRFDRPYGYR
jgi:hypothetical protein